MAVEVSGGSGFLDMDYHIKIQKYTNCIFLKETT
jgi:hypothetical protein